MNKHYKFPRILPVSLMILLFFAASCARSPYNFVKVQPKPFEKNAPVSTFQPGTIHSDLSGYSSSYEKPGFQAPYLKSATPVFGQSDKADASVAKDLSKLSKKERRKEIRKTVRRELQKSPAFANVSEKKLEKVEKIITRKAERIAKKNASSPAPPIGFNQWMKIGLILLLVGLVVGLVFGGLGYLVSVVGVVFLVLGLLQQL